MAMSFKEILSYLIHWIANVFLKLLKLKKTDRNTWIFGAARGLRYTDNSKYLFEHVQENLPEINSAWITKSKSVKEEITGKGYPCFLYNEKKGRKLRLKAGFIFFTNGIHDFGDFDLCQGGIKVALWHGMTLKKLNFATNYFRERHKSILRLVQYYIMRIYNKQQRDISIATSAKAKEFFMACFLLKPETVLITGQPRNDALFEKYSARSLKRKIEHQDHERFILYMPTWRDNGKHEGFHSGEAVFLNKIINQLNQDEEFLKTLKKENIKLYIKPHPNRTVTAEARGNIKLLSHDLKLDPQELLAAADALITDYSSTFIDYALMERPVHFFVPDLEKYKQGNFGVFLTFDEFANHWFKDLHQFKDAVVSSGKQQQFGLSNTQKINTIYDDPALKKGGYSEAVVSAILESEAYSKKR